MPPNIVLILADDMGYGDFGCFNEGLTDTPTLDHLVEEGVCLTQHYSASPVCAPARASLLTGRYPQRTGAIDTLEHRGLDRLALDETTVADLLRRAGYVTGLVGKWHNGAIDARYHPNRRGFDEFLGFSGGWQQYWDWRLDANGTAVKSDGRYLTDVFSDAAVDFLHRHRRDRFFLYLAYNAPHYPFQAPDDDVAVFREQGRHTTAVNCLYGMLRVLDRGVERVLDALRALGLADDTVVLFSSDNGPQFGGDGEMCTDRFNCGFRGAKTLVYEGGIRLPMVMRWPDGMEGRRRIDDLVHLTDWLPTLVALASASLPGDVALDGADVSPLLRGDKGRVDPVRFWQWNRYAPVAECNAAMRDGEWKLVRPAIAEAMELAPGDLAADVRMKSDPEAFPTIVSDPLPEREIPEPGPSQLFDLVADPGETTDLAGEEPGRVRKMEAELARWFEEVEADRRRHPDALP